MTASSFSNAEIVEALRLHAEHGSWNKASQASGIAASTLQKRAGMAAERGLTANTAVLTEVDRLKIALAAANRDVRALQREADTAERIRTEIYNLASRTPEPPAWLGQERNKSAIAGIPMTIWSDWHYGEVVRPEEVGGANEFNATIAGTSKTPLDTAARKTITAEFLKAQTALQGVAP